MKKRLSLAAAAVLLLSLTGCAAAESPLNHTYGKGDKDVGYAGTDIGGRPSEDRKAEGYEPEMAMDAAAGGAADGAPGALTAEPTGSLIIDPGDPGDTIDPSAPYEDLKIPPQAGLLTGGEWNDNAHWADWKALYGSRGDWNGYRTDWKTKDLKRVAVKVQNEKDEPLEGAKVSADGWMDAVTDNKGMAYLFGEEHPGSITVEYGGYSSSKDYSRSSADEWKDMTETFTIAGAKPQTSKKLDLMIMCDTTGSMADELEYLKEELSDIVKKIKSENANVPTRVSVNFYRDEGDEYEVRQFPFTENVDEAVKAIGEQYAEGGGDFPEAVHTALDSAVNNHDWDENSVKIMFLVLDAPPHPDAQIVDSVNSTIQKAAGMGIRVIPVASSGIDKSTEYLLRTMAFTTGGTYTFLTSDSGIGGEHIEPTVGAFNVEKLGDMMVRIVGGYLE